MDEATQAKTAEVIASKKTELEALAASSKELAMKRDALIQQGNIEIVAMNQSLAQNEMKAHEIKGAIEALEGLTK